MKSANARPESHHELRSKSFQFGYEEKSMDSRSVQTARADFLSKVLDTRPHIVLNLFVAAYQPFTDLMVNNANRIESICQAVDAEIPEAANILRQPKFIRERALDIFIPDWPSLQRIEGGDALCEALRNWAKRNNLTNEWCLNHALSFLRAWDGEDDKGMAIALLPDPHFLISVVKRCWQSAIYEHHRYGLRTQFQSNSKVEERGVFSFTFKHGELEFAVSGPFSKSVAAFRREVKQEFEAHGGRAIRGARKALQSELTAYINKVEKVVEELGLEAPETRWAVGDHLNWLVQYQAPPCKTCHQIGRECYRDERTVREGVQHAARLIGLTLRFSKLGRPKGVKETSPRRRVGRYQ